MTGKFCLAKGVTLALGLGATLAMADVRNVTLRGGIYPPTKNARVKNHGSGAYQSVYKIRFSTEGSKDLWVAMDGPQISRGGRSAEFGTPSGKIDKTKPKDGQYDINYLRLACTASINLEAAGDDDLFKDQDCYLLIDPRRYDFTLKRDVTLEPDASGKLKLDLKSGDAQFFLDFWDFQGEERDLTVETQDGKIKIDCKEPESNPEKANCHFEVNVQ